ncbi:F0F1 ATP synthase subunit delta [Romboutsia weinsteinii]|uniref:ATP synthase subunit delta n=1 Tax=Romboutsia weinsteinii TaxID=2020949 RepID=A0A371IZW3_9FIRM|nr:F0F1 ATP synthase subunit delta [Romboutsia weinsteinii]RDY26101.1 F0F1 ATP synthase subunit delta [Romboutsia weinsteinii]
MINVVAGRYAEALFQVGEEQNSTTKLYEELNEVVVLTNNCKDLYSALVSPLVTKREKKELVEKIFNGQISDNLKNFMKILIDRDRISALEAIEKTYKTLLNEKNNVIEGTVISAVAMNDKEIKELEAKLSSKYNKNVMLENKVDETILGGVLVRLGNEEIDGTVKTRLAKMKEQLSQVIS